MNKKNWFWLGVVSFAINVSFAIPEHIIRNNATASVFGDLRVLCWIIILIALIGWGVSKK